VNHKIDIETMGERREPAPGCKVFVGDLKPDTQEREVEEVFAKYGQLRNCFVARAPGGFGFVEFEMRVTRQRRLRL